MAVKMRPGAEEEAMRRALHACEIMISDYDIACGVCYVGEAIIK